MPIEPIKITEVSVQNQLFQITGDNQLTLVNKPGFFGRLFVGKPANTDLARVTVKVCEDALNYLNKKEGLDLSKLDRVHHNLTYLKDKADKHNNRWSVWFFGGKIDTSALDTLLSFTVEQKKLIQLITTMRELNTKMLQEGPDAFVYDPTEEGLMRRSPEEGQENSIVGLASRLKGQMRENIPPKVRSEIANYLDAMDPNYKRIDGVDGDMERDTPEGARSKLSLEAAVLLDTYVSLLRVIYEKDWSKRNNNPSLAIDSFLRAEALNISLAGEKMNSDDPAIIGVKQPLVQNRYRRAITALMYPQGLPGAAA